MQPIIAYLLLVILRLSQASPPVSLTQLAVVPSDGTILGNVADVDLLPDGRPVVLDDQSAEILVFGPSGKLMLTLGGKGQGPGEIGLGVEVEVGPDGVITVVDAGNQRLTQWSRDGRLIGSKRLDALLGAGGGWPHDLVWTDAGLFLKTSQFMPGNPLTFFRVPPDLQGQAELVVSIPEEVNALTCRFCPATFDGRGQLIAPRGDTLYEIAGIDGTGKAVREWLRRDLPAVRRTQRELDQLRSASGRVARESGASVPLPTFPAHKTRFGPHSIGVDDDGRLWVAPGVAENQNGFFDVFGPDGRFQGSVILTVPFSGFRIRGSRLVLASETALGEPAVRVYEIGP